MHKDIKYYFINKFETNNIDKLDNQTTVIYRNYYSETVNEKLITEGPVPVLKSTATIHDEKGLTLSTSAIVGVDLMQKGMQVPQQFGSASSYGKKYALGNLFLIDDTQDSDATNNHGKKTMTAQQIQSAKGYIKSGGKIDAIKEKYQLTSAQEAELKTL